MMAVLLQVDGYGDIKGDDAVVLGSELGVGSYFFTEASLVCTVGEPGCSPIQVSLQHCAAVLRVDYSVDFP